MSETPHNCSHPQMCPEKEPYYDVKTNTKPPTPSYLRQGEHKKDESKQ